MIDYLTSIFVAKSKKEDTPEGLCPNCWGRQEYADSFFEAVHHEKIDLNNINEKKGWIQAYAAQHLHTIKLSDNGTTKTCPSCVVSYE